MTGAPEDIGNAALFGPSKPSWEIKQQILFTASFS
jgi:hypothetical protein